MAGNVVSNVKKYYGGQVPVPGQGDSDGKVKMLVEKTATIEIEGVQTEVELLYDADDLTAPVTPQQLGQWTDENYLIVFKTMNNEGVVRGFVLYALSTESTSTDTLVNRAEFISFKGDMTHEPGASAYEFTMVEDSSTLARYLRDENGELIVKFDKASVEPGAQSGTLDNLISSDSEYMRFEVVHEGDNAYLNLNTESLDEELYDIWGNLQYILNDLDELPSDEHGYFNSSLITTPGDGTTTNIVIDDFRISQGRDVHGESIEFVPTHQEGGVDFGEVYLNPGTYIFTVHYTLQWVGNPRGTFLPLVTNVGDRPFDFSYEHEDVVRTTRIVTRTTRGKFSLSFPIDADTPPMGIWVKNLEIAQIASYNHPAVDHDTTLAGTGKLDSPLGVTPAAFGKIKDIPTSISQFRNGDVIPVDGPNGPAKMDKNNLLTVTAQNALAGNVAPAFDPTRTRENPYKPGERVVYNGVEYTFVYAHYGPWNAYHVISGDYIHKVVADVQSDIGSDSKVLKPKSSGWYNYDFRLYAGQKYNIAITGVSGTNYVRFIDKDGNILWAKDDVTENYFFEYTPSYDIYQVSTVAVAGLTITASHDGVYKMLKATDGRVDSVGNRITDVQSDIGTDSKTISLRTGGWFDYDFRLYAGLEYTLSFADLTGTNYIRLFSKDDTLLQLYTITEAESVKFTPSADVYRLQAATITGLILTASHDGAYKLLDTAVKTAKYYPFVKYVKGLEGIVDVRVYDTNYYKYRFEIVFVNYSGFSLYLRFQGFDGSDWVTIYNLERTAANPESGYEVINNDYFKAILDWNQLPSEYHGPGASSLHGELEPYCQEALPANVAQIADYAVKDTTKHVVTVKKDGTGDYTTIGAALSVITDSALDNQYEIVVYPGVYNENYLVTKPYVHIHGVQPGLVTITSEGISDTQAVVDFRSNAKLSNLNIVSHTGYCIHIDNQQAKCVVCTNVRVEKAVFGEAVGIGAHPGGTFVEFNGCSFVNGWCSAHTHYANTDQDNFRIRYIHCKFNQNGRIRVGLAAGIGNNIVEIVGYRGCIGQEAISYWTNEYRSSDEPDTYFASPTNWQIIGSDNKNFTFDRHVTDRHGLKVTAIEYNKDVSISGTAVDALFGVTKVKKSSPIIKGAVYGSLRVDDVQSGAGTEANPYVDRFQMWKRLGDCSVTNKTLSVTVDGATQTYTFDQDYTSSKPTEETILAAVNAVITNAVVSAYEPDFAECVNTTDKILIKIAETNGVVAGTWLTLDGYKSPSNSKAYNILGLALEDGAKDERIPVWIGDAFGFQGAGYTDGEYGIGSDGTLDSSASEKIGFMKWNRFYRF